MNRLAKLQLIGPCALFVTVLAAEAAAFALTLDPTSEFLWYVNLKLFVIFQRSYYLLTDMTLLPASQLVFVALPVLVIACYGVLRKRTLALAFASNLSFIYAGFLVFSWIVSVRGTMQASLSLVFIPSGPGLYTLLVLLGCSLLSSVVSHLIYVRAIRAQG